MNKIGFFKKFIVFALVITAVLFVFVGCENKTSGQNQPADIPPANPSGEIVDPFGEKETAFEIVSEIVEKANLGNLYDNAILSNVQSKYVKVEAITLINLQKDVHGKLTITANVKDENNQTKAVTFEYEGDTTMLCEKESNENIIAQILAKAEIEMNAELVKDSKASEQLKTLASIEVDLIKTQITALSNLEVTEKQEVQPQVEYVSVQSIVDEIWGDVDTDADIKAIAKYLTDTEYKSAYDIEKILAIDFKDNSLVLYSQISYKKNGKEFLMKNDVPINTENDFYVYIQSKKEKLNKVLKEKSLTLNQDVVKDSADERNLRTKLSEEREVYDEEKNRLLNMEGKNITEETLFQPNMLSASQMQELGIENMNEFAEALQNNKKGTGYDIVEGWTMDDVVETYVKTPTAPNISGVCSYRICVVLKGGIKEFAINVLNGSGMNAYRKTLNDSADASLVAWQDDVVYTDNAIIYDNEGERITDNSQVQTFWQG